MGYKFRDENLGKLYENYATINISHCISCGKTDFENWAESGPYKTYKCLNCQLIFMNPQLNEDGLNNYYSNYIGKRRLSNSKKMEQRSEQYILDAEIIKKFITRGDILDVGCNGGFFLDVMGDEYERFGTELDREAVEYARNNFEAFRSNIYNGHLHSAKFPENNFNLVMMRGVIEHVLNPEESIKEISKILKPGGYFYICATPNGESYCANLYRENWTLFHPVQHLWHFSPNNLSMICKRHNLNLVWKEYPYLGTPYENVKNDVLEVSNYIIKNDVSLSPAFFENMMSLVFKKL